MKLATRVATVLALAAFAVPALACDGMKTQQATKQTPQKPAIAKAEKKAAPKAEKN
jgi:hypothetical protein